MNQEYFEKEKDLIWHELEAIKIKHEDLKYQLSEFTNSLPESIEEAKNTITVFNDLTNNVHSSKKEVDDILSNIKLSNEVFEKLQVDCDSCKTKVDSLYEKYNESLNKIVNKIDDVELFIENIEKKSSDSNSIFDELSEKFKDCNSNSTKISAMLQQAVKSESDCRSLVSKIEGVYKSSESKYNEILNLYEEIVGYESDDIDNDGSVKRVEGLKSKLEKAYDVLEQNFSKKSDEIVKFEKKQIEDYNFIRNEYKEWLNEKRNEVVNLQSKINELMPEAMAAGLSGGYLKKKNEELDEKKNAEKMFFISICSMIVISSFVAFSSIYLLATDKTFLEVIILLPRIVSAVIPFYIPAIWFAVVANKKINLSKRLIEEYAHKEALAKTFVGLSNHVEGYSSENVNADLKSMLLINMIQTSAENPGKLIKGYATSDSPIHSLLEKFTGIFRPSSPPESSDSQ